MSNQLEQKLNCLSRLYIHLPAIGLFIKWPIWILINYYWCHYKAKHTLKWIFPKIIAVCNLMDFHILVCAQWESKMSIRPYCSGAFIPTQMRFLSKRSSLAPTATSTLVQWLQNKFCFDSQKVMMLFFVEHCFKS